VQPRDTELLFVASTAAGATGTPAGWTLVKQQSTTPLQIKVFKRTAGSSDAGATVKVPVLAPAGIALQLADYSGVASTITAAGSSGSTASVTHATPTTTVSVAGSWVLSYWADRSSTTTGWTLPGGVTSRDVVLGTGKNYTSAALADSGKAVPLGTSPGRTASVIGGPSGKAAMFTIVLRPSL
jgi:hypothetical protein